MSYMIYVYFWDGRFHEAHADGLTGARSGIKRSPMTSTRRAVILGLVDWWGRGNKLKRLSNRGRKGHNARGQAVGGAIAGKPRQSPMPYELNRAMFICSLFRVSIRPGETETERFPIAA